MNPADQPASSKIGLPPKQFAAAFPFHFALDRDLRLLQAGSTLRRICRDVRPGMDAREVFRTIQPEGRLTWQWILDNWLRFFLLEHSSTGLQLRGEFVLLPGEDTLVFLGSPWFADAAEIAAHGLGFEDFAIHDPVVDMLQVFQASKAALADANKLAAKLTQQRAELRSANERLHQQEAETRRLALIAARTDNAVVLADAEGKTVWVNEGFSRLTGYALEEMRGRKPGSVLQGPGTEAETVRRIRDQLRKGAGFSEEILNYKKDGRTYWVAIEVQPIYDDAGRLVNYMSIQKDITARRAAQRRLAIQFEVSRVLVEADELHTGLHGLLRVISQNLGWQVGEFWRMDTGRLRFMDLWHFTSGDVAEFVSKSRSMEFARGVGLPGRVWLSRGPVWIPDVTCDLDFLRRKVAAKVDLHGAFGFPVSVRGELWGVMAFYSRNIEEPDDALLKTFASVGNQIGQFIARQEAERNLRDSERRYRDLFERTSDLIQSVAEDGSFVYVNRAWRDCLGYEEEDLRHLKVWDVIHPDCWGHCADIFGRLMAGEQVGRIEVKFVTKSALTVIAEGFVYVSTGEGMVKQTRGMFRDITRRVQAEEELRLTNALQQAILEGANYSIISTAPDGTIFTFNSAAERMLGYGSEEVVGKVTPAIIHDSSEVAARAAELTHELGRPVEPGFEAFVAKAALGKPDEREWTYIRKDGSRFPVLLSVTALFDDRGEVTGYLGIASDITERKRAASELLAAKQAAEAANQAKSEFLATISHELRTPLTSIRGFLQTLLSDPEMPSQARQEFLTITHDQSMRLSRLVDDLLDLSSLESGRTQFNDEHLDLRQIAETCLAGIGPLAGSKSQRVETDIADSLPAFNGDAVRLLSVFTNLLGNAVKFTPAGGTVRLELGLSGGTIRIMVQDTGPGIPADQHKMIFEKFHRVYRRGASTSGTGLGLPIVKAIVEHYHGRIELDSEEGRGSCFRVYLPLHTA